MTYTDTDKIKSKHDNKRFCIAVFGSVSVWVPTGSSLVASNHLSRLEEDYERVSRFYSRFNGKRCKLCDVCMRVLTAFGLHNSGGSDEGTVTTMAAAFWVSSYIMGKPLTPEQLGCGTPSESFLYKWEKRYAAECFLLKCFEVKKRHQRSQFCRGSWQ